MGTDYEEWREAVYRALQGCLDGLPAELARLIVAAEITESAFTSSETWDGLRSEFSKMSDKDPAPPALDVITKRAQATADLFRSVLADYEGARVYKETLGEPPTKDGKTHIISRSINSPFTYTQIHLNGETQHRPAFFHALVTACDWAWVDARGVQDVISATADYAAGMEKVFVAINNLMVAMEQYAPDIGKSTPTYIRYADWDDRKRESEIFGKDWVDYYTGLRGHCFNEPPPSASWEDAMASKEPTLNQLLAMVRQKLANIGADFEIPSPWNPAVAVIGQSRKQKGEIVQIYLRTVFEQLHRLRFPIEGNIENRILPIARLVSGLEIEPHHIRQAWKTWKNDPAYKPLFDR